MTSVGKKLAQNIAAKGRAALKPTFPSKKAGHPRDEFDINTSFGHDSIRKNGSDNLSANIGVGTPLYKGGHSSSLGSVHSVDNPMDHEQIVMLTHFVRTLSDSLSKLKAIFCEEDVLTAEELRVAAHEKLGDVLTILKDILQKYPALHTTDVLTTAAMLITKIKSAHYEEMSQDCGNLLYMIDQLSLAFSSSVSDYLMGDLDNFPTIGKTKSYDNLASDANLDDQPSAPEKNSSELSEEIDSVLQHLEGHSGVDRALLQAKLWAKYVKEIIVYVEKKNALENEYSKSLTKLANSLKNSVVKETYLPMQAIFCTAFDQDMDFSAASQATCTIIQNQKFVEPLNARRLEHEKTRKHLRDMWAKELKRMQEAVSNLQKAKSNYIKCQQEVEKARDAAIKADGDNQAQGTTAQAKVLEKKRKLEEDALQKAAEAETTYKACVAEANYRQKSLEKVKCKVLAEIRDLIYHSDQVMKQVTVVYFQLLHTLSAPKPVQFQTLCEGSQQYDPGSQYVEYVKRIHTPADMVSAPEPFYFEPYTPEYRSHDLRKPGQYGSYDGHFMEGSPMIGRDGKPPSTLKVHTEDDTDSVSDSSSRSQESSPTASPYQARHPPLAGSISLGKLGDTHSKDRHDARLGVVCEQVRLTFRGIDLSQAAQTHLFKKLRTLSKCRECESYVYFQGAECELCGLTSHKKCLESLHWECGHKSVRRRMTTFGVDFSEHVQETRSDIPRLIWKCTKEIDERGLDIKGIYRVSGVKSKVESLCQEFDMDESNCDLSEHNPNVIANVLKLYLRQLPEPLLSFAIYPEFIRLAKLEQQSGGGQGPASQEILDELKSLIHGLPRPQFKTCGHLMHHLKRVTESQETNQMSAYNLGVVFGPTLLRQSEDNVSLDSLLDTPCQTRMVELLIVCADMIFGSVDNFMPQQNDDSSITEATVDLDLDTSDSAAVGGNEPSLTTTSVATLSVTADTSKTTPETYKKLVPEITRELAPSDAKRQAPPSPTLLELAGQSSLRIVDQTSSTSTPDECRLMNENMANGSGVENPTEKLSDSPSSVTIHYKSLSPPMKSTTPNRLGALIQGHSPLSPSLSLGSVSSAESRRQRKQILTAHVLKSRDSSPTEQPKLQQLTKPKTFTPPTHRRLCKTGTGGLLERPTTPDPYMLDSDDSSEETQDADSQCKSLPPRLISMPPMTPLTMTECILPQPLESQFYANQPMTVTLAKSKFYTSPISSKTPSSTTNSLDANINNNSSSQNQNIEEMYPVTSPGATSTFYTPSARMGRRSTYDSIFDEPPSIESKSEIKIPRTILGRRSSSGLEVTSPPLAKTLIPKHDPSEAEYV